MSEQTIKYFTTYSGVGLPLKMVNELAADSLDNRNTYFCAYYDDQERLVSVQKRVYDEVELEHCYEYHPDDRISRAVITMAGDEPQVIEFPA